MVEALTLQRLNDADDAGFVALLAGIYEHSPWVAERAASRRPFATLAQLKRSLVEAVTEAPREERLALLRAHPELAGKAMVAKALTAESSHEQGKAGLTACTPDEYATLQRLNAAYNEKFGFPFMIFVRGHTKEGIFFYLDRWQQTDPSTDEELHNAMTQVWGITRSRVQRKVSGS